MKKTALFLVSIALCGLCACKKDGSSINAQKSLLLGKWMLQQQHLVSYVDGAKTKDTTYSQPSAGVINARFNSDGSFSSVGIFSLGAPLPGQAGSNLSVDSLRGTFAISGDTFNISTPLIGFDTDYAFSGGVSFTDEASIVTVSPVSRSAQIISLTKTDLKLHIEFTVNKSAASVTKTYKTLLDYSYTR